MQRRPPGCWQRDDAWPEYRRSRKKSNDWKRRGRDIVSLGSVCHIYVFAAVLYIIFSMNLRLRAEELQRQQEEERQRQVQAARQAEEKRQRQEEERSQREQEDRHQKEQRWKDLQDELERQVRGIILYYNKKNNDSLFVSNSGVQKYETTDEN